MGRKPRVDRSPEEKWQIVQEGLKSGNVSETCRRFGIAQTLFYRWKDEAEQHPSDETVFDGHTGKMCPSSVSWFKGCVHTNFGGGRACRESQARVGNGGVLKVGVRSNREQSSFPECFCGGSIEFLTCGVVNVPEFLSKPAKLNSDHAPTEMLLAYERHAASLIFLSGHIHQNELLPRLH